MAIFLKNINVDDFVDLLQNTKHQANDASNDVNRPLLDQIQSDLRCPNVLAVQRQNKLSTAKVQLMQPLLTLKAKAAISSLWSRAKGKEMGSSFS